MGEEAHLVGALAFHVDALEEVVYPRIRHHLVVEEILRPHSSMNSACFMRLSFTQPPPDQGKQRHCPKGRCPMVSFWWSAMRL